MPPELKKLVEEEKDWIIEFRKNTDEYLSYLQSLPNDLNEREKTLIFGNIRGFSEHLVKQLGDWPEKIAKAATDARDAKLTEKIEGMLLYPSVCTCDRRVCHCGKFPTANEEKAYNSALSEVRKLIARKE